ncbi:MAG: hypothetical protein EOP13_25960 [Pseudomonas sp.]|jgi:hypothetical protein|uniref:hypothetical protein n=1 Tax=Pseudomonas sp. TaxID=306 RepID=UPI00122BD0B5|nr:hypothetical protein [Pseudomonas sp.]RZI68256.1 MAG: hypothetical protein EOP13_25960 [Pseudomonas sp.]
MHHFSPARWLVIAPVAAAVFAAAAQTPEAPSDAPGPAQVAPTALSYRSALEGFQGFTDEKAVPWQQANDTVHQRGGWKAYAKEASETGPATGASGSAGHAHGEGAHTMPSGASMSMPLAPRKGQP